LPEQAARVLAAPRHLQRAVSGRAGSFHGGSSVLEASAQLAGAAVAGVLSVFLGLAVHPAKQCMRFSDEVGVLILSPRGLRFNLFQGKTNSLLCLVYFYRASTRVALWPAAS
jgi:hypothetical protein